MAALYLYAITDRPDQPPGGGPGLGGEALQSVVCRDIAAIVSPLGVGEVEPTAANVWRHERVIEALMAERAALPARFGVALKSAQVMQERLAERYDAFAANLERVRGRVELGLRVLWRAAEPAPRATRERASGGYSYLMARLDEERHAETERRAAEAQVAELVHDLAPLAVDRVEAVLVTPRLLLNAAYLVDRRQVPAFEQAVRQQQAGHPELRFLCTGPWPAYHFVTAD